MLLSLSVKNYLLIENTYIELDKGFNVITGETGSGKSMILSALMALKSQHLTGEQIRDKEQPLVISASFSKSDMSKELSSILEDYTAADEEIIITRTIKKDSRSSILINGTTAPMKVARDIIDEFIYFSSQREQNTLLKSSTALSLIDSFSSLKEKSEEVKECSKKAIALRDEIDELRLQVEKSFREQDWLLSVQREIESASIKLGEDEEIKRLLKGVKSALLYNDILKDALSFLSSGEYSACYKLNKISSDLRRLSDKEEDASLLESIERINDAHELLSEVSYTLEKRLSSLSLTEEEIDMLNERDNLLTRLKRKYGGSLEKVLEYKKEVDEALCIKEDGEKKIELLEKKYREVYKNYTSLRDALFTERMNGAKKLSLKTTELLRTLEMPDATFMVELEKGADFAEDKALFLFSANKGEEEKDVAKVSSGGELSRIFLAILTSSPLLALESTIVFDEIDSGLGGKTAERVKEYLQRLSKSQQILVITHSPSIATGADLHIKMKKSTKNERALVEAMIIHGTEREEEIARMLNGKSTKESLALAKKMLG